MRLEVGNRHPATCDESDDWRTQAERNQTAAEELNQSSGKAFGIVEFGLLAEYSEQFLRPMTGKEEAGRRQAGTERRGDPGRLALEIA
jgi:hypothetical protein